MNDFLVDLWHALTTFYRDFIGHDFADWWLLPLVLAIIYVLGMIVIRIHKKMFPLQRAYRIISGMIISGLIAAFLLCAVFCYVWSTSAYYTKVRPEFVHLLSFLVAMLIPLWGLLVLRGKYNQVNFKEISRLPFTAKERDRFHNAARKDFNKLKSWLLLPALGFLLLFALNYRQANLISFILDNSSSMDEHIENGKDALSRTINELDANNDVIIGWFTETRPMRQNVMEIVQETAYQNLLGEHSLITDRNQVSQYLSNVPRTGTTPLCEVIWSNYLYAQNAALNKVYDRKMLIIVTDGAGAISKYAEVQDFLCSQAEFDEFFYAVSCINLGGDLDNNFFPRRVSADTILKMVQTKLLIPMPWIISSPILKATGSLFYGWRSFM